MNRLRQLHLYLGCIFTPLLVFFAISGLWQNYFFHYPHDHDTHPRLRQAAALLSSLHTGRGLKAADGPETLSSPVFRFLVTAMALSLLLTMVLGVVTAFRFGHRRVATVCLIAGVVVPVSLVVSVLI